MHKSEKSDKGETSNQDFGKENVFGFRLYPKGNLFIIGHSIG